MKTNSTHVGNMKNIEQESLANVVLGKDEKEEFYTCLQAEKNEDCLDDRDINCRSFIISSPHCDWIPALINPIYESLSAIHIATSQGYYLLLRYILERYAGSPKTLSSLLNVRDAFGDTPLMYSVKASNPNKLIIAELFVSYGADMSAFNDSGETPLSMAIMNKDYKMVEIMAARNTSTGDQAAKDKQWLNRDADGRTALYWAFRSLREGQRDYMRRKFQNISQRHDHPRKVLEDMDGVVTLLDQKCVAERDILKLVLHRYCAIHYNDYETWMVIKLLVEEGDLGSLNMLLDMNEHVHKIIELY